MYTYTIICYDNTLDKGLIETFIEILKSTEIVIFIYNQEFIKTCFKKKRSKTGLKGIKHLKNFFNVIQFIQYF